MKKIRRKPNIFDGQSLPKFQNKKCIKSKFNKLFFEEEKSKKKKIEKYIRKYLFLSIKLSEV